MLAQRASHMPHIQSLSPAAWRMNKWGVRGVRSRASPGQAAPTTRPDGTAAAAPARPGDTTLTDSSITCHLAAYASYSSRLKKKLSVLGSSEGLTTAVPSRFSDAGFDAPGLPSKSSRGRQLYILIRMYSLVQALGASRGVLPVVGHRRRS